MEMGQTVWIAHNQGRGSNSSALSVHTEEIMKHTVTLKQNHEFRRLYGKGKSAVSPYFVIYCRKTRRPVSRLGITNIHVTYLLL